jgi:hypothetical protein
MGSAQFLGYALMSWLIIGLVGLGYLSLASFPLPPFVALLAFRIADGRRQSTLVAR